MPIRVRQDPGLIDFKPPTFDYVDFGSPSSGFYSAGYKMVAFEPGKILQAQELNEIQFRLQTERSLTNMMISNWIGAIVQNGGSTVTGPGWSGATPITPNAVSSLLNTNSLIFYSDYWYLCKTNSNGLYFWVYLKLEDVAPITGGQLIYTVSNVPLNSYIGFNLNTSGNSIYTGQIANCKTLGPFGLHRLNSESGGCSSSRYYVKITNIVTNPNQISNSFVAVAQRREDGFYFLNNIKVTEERNN